MVRATNSARMRQKNEKIILSLIGREPISRAEIAKATGLTRAAVTIIIDDLKSKGIIIEKYVHIGSVGRNPVMLYLNGDAVYVIGINITRLGITVGISDLCGKVITETTLPALPPDKAFDKIKATVKRQITASGIDPSKIYKAAVVTPGPVDIESGRTLNPPNFPEWHNVPVRELMQKAIKNEVLFENVSSAVSLAEKYFGAAKGVQNFMTLQVDEGIGSGIVYNGKLFRGPCEFGHISIKYDGEKCKCGNSGCLELYASIPNLLKDSGLSNWKEAVDTDSPMVEKEAEYLGSAMISANHIFNLDTVVLCGDLTYKPEKIINLISGNVDGNMFKNEDFRLSAGKVNSKSLIAASVAINDFFF